MIERESANPVVLDFLIRLVEDLRAGELASLAEYQAAFPGADGEIAAEFAAVTCEQDSADEVEAEAPPRIGPFEIVREVGRGGQGTVYLAIDERLRRRVALKVVDRGVFQDEAARLRLRREAELASRLDDRGICTVHEVGAEGGVDYIAMRYLGGGSLADRIQAREDLPQGKIIDEDVALVESVARSLHGAHEVGIVHRDVKPANVMLDDTGRPVLVDFGFARDEASDQASLTMTGVVFGTPPYMSPEQLSGLVRPLDRRTDVYSLGVVLYQLLTGVVPHRAPTITALLLLLRTTAARDPRKLNPAVSRDLAVVVLTALEADLPRRYANAEVFADDLRNVLEGRPIAARPAGLLYRTARWARRNPAAIAVMTIAFVALALVTFILWREARFNRDLVQLTDNRLVSELLVREKSELLPLRDEVVDLGNVWLGQAAEIIAKRGDHIRFRDSLRDLGRDMSRNEAWTLELVEELIDDIARIEGKVPEVRARVDEARGFRGAWSEGAAAVAWEECIDAVADSRRYGGLELEPQEGLVPLGESPHSGLWEFFVLGSGARPVRDPDKWADERWDDAPWDAEAGDFVVTPETGIVLVLIPGGDFRMGCRQTIPEAVENDPFSAERPLHDVTLAPFFIAKYEVTQAQWMRMHEGDNPSWYPPGTDRARDVAGDEVVTPAHPVEHVDRDGAIECARRWGLVLPTEAQWEYACRGGTDDASYRGGYRSDLSLHENLSGAERGTRAPADGLVRHAPVGFLGPNPFGIHDMLGNVSEWCRDPVVNRYDLGRHRPGDGLRIFAGADPHEALVRGSSFLRLVAARAAFRYRTRPTTRAGDLGFRVSRRLDDLEER